MNTKHTPGPWRISGCQLGAKLLIEYGGEHTHAPIIGSVYLDGGNLPQAANANLIAAAPDLLAALEECLATLESPAMVALDKSPWLSEAIGIKIGIAREAIKKAGGRA